MSIFPKFLSVVAITIGSGVLSYAAVQSAGAPKESILIATCATVLIQILLSLNYSKTIDADRAEAFKVVKKICKKSPSINAESSFSVLMKDLEEMFRDTLRKESKVVENAADVICLVSTEGNILSANPASKSVLGYTPDELVGTKLSDYYVGGDEEDTLNPLLGGDESIHKISMENRFRRKDGTIIDLLWSAHWSATDNGLFCVAHDITERKYAEKVLKESEERIRFILESLPAGICVLGISGEIEFINKTAMQLCLINDELILGQQANSIFKPCAEPFSIDGFVNEMAIEDPRVLSTANEEIPVEISVRKIDWEEKPACLVMFVDASEKHAAEQARQQFLRMQDEAIALRQKLMDMVVHDIRGPLSSLLSTQELLLRGVGVVVGEKIRTRLENCQDDVKRIIRLLNDLLKISRHEATKLNLSLADNEIGQLITQAANSVRDLATEKSVSIKTEVISATVAVDSDRILQVLFNLLSNAIKFSPRNSTILISSEIESESGAVRISVSDEGRGIPEGSETSIFLAYSQVSWTDSAEKGGTGLGLAICREIVEDHGGTIQVANNSSGGATFWFTVPNSEHAQS